MNEPWFNPSLYAWLPGTAMGVAAGCWGALAGTLGPRGQGRGLVLGAAIALIAVAAALFLAGVAALIAGQPYGVWYGLGFPGLLCLILLPTLLPKILRQFQHAEDRRLHAQDFG